MRLFRVIRELRNFREYKRIIKEESLKSPKWTKYRLRKDWLYRVYTVINLPPQVLNSPDFPAAGRPSFVMEEILPINRYLGDELNLNEIITVNMKPIKEVNGDSFLVVYHFLFRELTILWMVKYAAVISGLIWGWVEWDTIYSAIIGFLG